MDGANATVTELSAQHKIGVRVRSDVDATLSAKALGGGIGVADRRAYGGNVAVIVPLN